MQVAHVILKALQTQALGVPPPAQARSNSAGSVHPTAVTAIQTTVDRIFDHCQQVSDAAVQQCQSMAAVKQAIC